MKILWLTPKWTLPANDGARVATDSLIRNTAAAGAVIDVLIIAPVNEAGNSEELKEKWKIRNAFYIPRMTAPAGKSKVAYHLVNFVTKPHLPLTFVPFFDEKVISQVKKLLDLDQYDFILLDGLHLGAIFLKMKIPKGTRIIYRAHNIEQDLWIRSFQETTNPFLKPLFLYQSKLVSRFESAIINKAALIAPIADEDKQKIQNMDPAALIKLVPLGLNFNRTQSQSSKDKTQFLFIGKLDWAPNKDGLKWLLNEVWPEVIKRRPEASLKIVGSGDGSWLKPYADLPGVNFVGFVKEIHEAYEDCQFTVVPVFYGSGTRIKVIESFTMGKRLISTKLGVQGANLREIDFVHAEAREEWITVLSTIKYDDSTKELARASKSYMSDLYCEKKVGEDFYNWLSVSV